MQYQYATERPDYSHLASGRVFYSLPGHPAFPVRLASEVFQRCLAHRAAHGRRSRCVLYDPCCGGGYSLSVLAFLHRAAIHTAIGSDIDAQAVRRAERNLSLTTVAGLERRAAELAAHLAAYGKDSHREALDSLQFIQARVAASAEAYPLTTRVFQADVTAPAEVVAGLGGVPVDIVLTDVPYGQHSTWQHAAPDPDRPDPTWALLDTLRRVLSPGGLVALVSGKQGRVSHAGYRAVERFQVGKRRISIWAALA